MNIDRTGAHMFAPIIPSYQNTTSWLSVSEAIIRCTERGLSRTPKTLRRWASLSHQSPETGDFTVRREVTDNGYKWLIEPASLDRKIDEELEFDAAKQGEHVRTGAHLSGQDQDIRDELRAQLEQAKAEVDFLRGELIHRRETDKALGSVIEAFKLNAETTKGQMLAQAGDSRERGWGDRRRHDIVPSEGEELRG